MSQQLTTYVALLRGINVGGNTMVKMADLKACFEDLGLQQVSTYINSGNVLFRSSQTDPRKLEAAIEAALTKQFSYNIRTVVRSLDEIRHMMRQLPKSWQHPEDKKCNVIFLSHTIDKPDILDGFNPKPGIEEVYYHPGVLFWSAQTSQLTKSDMLKTASRPVYKEMTIRILNTAKKIYDLMQALDKSPEA